MGVFADFLTNRFTAMSKLDAHGYVGKSGTFADLGTGSADELPVPDGSGTEWLADQFVGVVGGSHGACELPPR